MELNECCINEYSTVIQYLQQKKSVIKVKQRLKYQIF